MATGGKNKRASSSGRQVPRAHSERRDTDSRWVLLFSALVIGGLTTALVLSRGNDGPPIPTYSPPPPTPTEATETPTEATEDPEDTSSPRPTTSPTVDERKAVFPAVHGMARAGEGLLLATEEGVWRLPDKGGARRVDGPRHRLSTLVRRDARTLYASGLDRDGKPLGLLSGRDGTTWTTESLAGEAGFKRLVFAGERLYGWDAGTGRMLTTTDLRTWEERSAVQGLHDFAVHPADPTRMVRAVPEGGVGLPEVQESRDAGRTWKRIAAPSLFLFAWPRTDTLWALTEDGTVFVSRDAGHSWSPRSILPAPPTAFLDAGEEGLFAALREVGVYRSTDSAKSWRRVDL